MCRVACKMYIGATFIPSLWNEKYLQYLGVKVANDVQGCLQDVHWSHGSFGYFATYSVGSLYAAQFYTTYCKQRAVVKKTNAGIDTNEILTWLQSNIYETGRQFSSEELCKKATGNFLDASYFLNYVNKKYANIYKL